MEGHRVREKAIDTLLTGRGDERLGVVDVRATIQDLDDVRIGQEIESQDHDLGVRRDVLQVLPIIRAKPVRLPARQAETRSPKDIETRADLI